MSCFPLRFLLFCLPLIFFCCQKKDSWQHSAIRNTDPRYDLAKLTYPADTIHRGIEIELIRQHEGIEGYVNVHTFEVPPFQDELRSAKISFFSDNLEYNFIVDRLQGGQRLHLSEAALSTLLSLFEEHSEVTIEMAHYSQAFNGAAFTRHYQKLCNLPPRFLPEKIVTFELY